MLTHEQLIQVNRPVVIRTHLTTIKAVNELVYAIYAAREQIPHSASVALNGPEFNNDAESKYYARLMAEIRYYGMIYNYQVMGKHQARHRKAINKLFKELWL